MKDPFAKPDPERQPAVRLKPLQVAGFTAPIAVQASGLTLGRADDNDVVFAEEAFPSVSSHHARIDRDDDKLILRDLGSRNGTLLNGERIDESPLKVGDLVQLGAIGPRFVLISTAPLSETMFVDPKKLAVSEGDVEELVHRRATTQTLRIAVLGLVIVSALGAWIFKWTESQEGDSEANRVRTDEMFAGLREENDARSQAWQQIGDEQAEYVRRLESDLARYEEEASTLRERLASIEDSGASTEVIAGWETSLATTRAELEAARARLDMVDPINLQAARLSDVGRVREAVVLIEATVSLVKEGKELFLDDQLGPNWDGLGERWTQESTGTGFVISSDGYLLTNNHVLDPTDENPLIESARQQGMEASVQLEVVFNGGTERHPLEVVSSSGSVDLALAKIEPFLDMPYVHGFSPDTPAPLPGGDVYLVGFPLGNFALQEGNRVIASTFRGILSRVVDDTLQVDAGVHPGNSGGPIVDPAGRVIGVVFSVQATPEQTAVYTIGYGIPIARVRELWPLPPREAAAEAK